MPDPYTIRIFVPDGDPEGVRVIDRMNWTGVGWVFPRSKWPDLKGREAFDGTGAYILVGYSDQKDTPTIYIGQGDEVRDRINTHYRSKDFWNTAIVFVSSSGALNRAHVTWLEYALVARANEIGRCKLDNGNVPAEPGLSEAEKADTQGFLGEVLRILPLVNLRVFETPTAVASPRAKMSETPTAASSRGPDTIVVPARKEGFDDVFIGEDCWYPIRIAGGMLDQIKYIAAYQIRPVSAVTHFAPVDHIETYGSSGKYRLVFSEKAQTVGPIPFGDAPIGLMQAPRYTTLKKLKTARKVSDLFVKK